MLKILNNLDIFFEDTTRQVSIREFARIKKISPATAGKILREYKKNGIVCENRDRNYIFFRANSSLQKFTWLSRIYWINKLEEILDEIDKFYNFPTIFLFGSINKGENNLKSDIDLFIITNKKEEFIIPSKIKNKIKREIQIFTAGNKDEVKNKNLLKNMLNGTKIRGEIEWI